MVSISFFVLGKGFLRTIVSSIDRAQLTLQFNRAFDENKTQKPMSLVRYFYQRLYQTDSALFDELDVSEKEVNFASTLLDKHSFEEACDFIHYGLKEARKTKFDIKTFEGSKNTIPSISKRRKTARLPYSGNKNKARSARKRGYTTHILLSVRTKSLKCVRRCLLRNSRILRGKFGKN
jgi:hypothetical protein